MKLDEFHAVITDMLLKYGPNVPVCIVEPEGAQEPSEVSSVTVEDVLSPRIVIES